MSGLFSQLKSLFFTASEKRTASNPSSEFDTSETSMSFSFADAQRGFYASILGDDDAKSALTVPQKLCQSVVEKSLKDKENRMKAVPRLPSIIPKLLQSIRDPNSSTSHFVNIINKDPALSAAVLKLANSVYFNPIAKRVTSIETAVVKLGINGLRLVLSTAVMQPLIERKSYYYAEFGHKLWAHSLHCAVACELIARQRGLEPYKAYLLGLIHDIGKITIFSELCSQFQLNFDSEKPGYKAFAPLLLSRATTISYQTATDWEMPDEICEALKEQISPSEGDKLNSYSQLLYEANYACEIYTINKFNEEQNESALISLKSLNLPVNLFEQLDLISVDL